MAAFCIVARKYGIARTPGRPGLWFPRVSILSIIVHRLRRSGVARATYSGMLSIRMAFLKQGYESAARERGDMRRRPGLERRGLHPADANLM